MTEPWSTTRGCGGGGGGGDTGDDGANGSDLLDGDGRNPEDTIGNNEATPPVAAALLHRVDHQVSVGTGTASSSQGGSLLEASSYRPRTIPVVASSLRKEQEGNDGYPLQSAEEFVQIPLTDNTTTTCPVLNQPSSSQPPSALKTTTPTPAHRKRQRNSHQNHAAFPIIPDPQISTSHEVYFSAGKGGVSATERSSNRQYYNQQQHANSQSSSTQQQRHPQKHQQQHFNTQELIPPSYILSRHHSSNSSNGKHKKDGSSSSKGGYHHHRQRNNNNDNADHDCYHSHYRSLPIPPPMWWLQHDQPDTAHFTQLLSALVLTTALAVLAGYDAKQHCLEHETNAILELTSSSSSSSSQVNSGDANNNDANAAGQNDIDDDVYISYDGAAADQEAYEAAYDEAVLIEMDGCIKMFRHILLPNLVVTFTLGCLGLYVLKQPQKTPRDAYMWTLRLVLILVVIAIMQTYTVLSIMLMPRNEQYVSDTENPYQSLGAVDLLGHVGDNANLYYLSWVSQALVCALVYQTVTATVRARRAVQTQALSQQVTSSHHGNAGNATFQSSSAAATSRYPLLPATSWSNIDMNSTSCGMADGTGTAIGFLGSGGTGDAAAASASDTTGGDDAAGGGVAFTVGHGGSAGIMKTASAIGTAATVATASPYSFDSAQQDKEHHESRNTWYQSLYKLRIRTGIWSAALISCLVLTASAQYVWRQVLWPSVMANDDDDTGSFNYGDEEFGEDGQQYDQAASSSAATAAESWDFGFAVCQTIAIHSAKALSSSGGSGNAIPAQMCRRTLMAWLVGVLACLLSTFSIGMHLVARTYHHHHDEVGHDAGAAVAAANSMHQLGHHHMVDPRNSNNILTILEHHHDELLQNDTYYLHYRTTLFRQLLERHRVPLGIELVLSILLSLLLGCNAVLATGVQGPAANVGNLYYASWFAFLLLIRICLGCLEEWYEVEKTDDLFCGSAGGAGDNPTNGNTPDFFSALSNVNKKPFLVGLSNDQAVTEIGYKAAPDDGSMRHDQGVPEEKPSQETDHSVQSMMDPSEKDRVNRLRSYFFLGIFSAVCAASSYDAGANHEGSLSRAQQYFIVSPLIVACLSLILFILCLSKRCYLVASHYCVGGVLSVVFFVLWLCDLILTMHSDDSWAVNGIGEIEMANLYYFSWAGMLTAGLQLMSYVQALFGISKGEDYMTVVWVAIVKVCFVILGAAVHIWHAIADKCDLNYVLSNGAFSFCSRTIVAMIIAMTGMLVGGLVVLTRMMLGLCCPKCHCSRMQAHIEMLLSSFLVFLFLAAVALITSIGGPGQSVGDLYYSTWLAFWVSLGIFVSCYDQINREEDEQEKEKVQEMVEEYNPNGDYRREVDEPRPTAMGGSVLV